LPVGAIVVCAVNIYIWGVSWKLFVDHLYNFLQIFILYAH